MIAEPVDERFVGPIVVIALFTVFVCCSGATYIVRTARDSNITLNAISIRRQYQRNMQLYCLMKDKMLIDANRRMEETSQNLTTQNTNQDDSFDLSKEEIEDRRLKQRLRNKKHTEHPDLLDKEDFECVEEPATLGSGLALSKQENSDFEFHVDGSPSEQLGTSSSSSQDLYANPFSRKKLP